MPPSASKTLLVIPAYRESQRLPNFLPELCTCVAGLDGDRVAIQVVDDGSGSAEQELLAGLVSDLQEKHDFLLEPVLLDRNRGKGGAVYAGWDGHVPDGSFGLLGFVDADGAVSPAEVLRLLRMIPGLQSDQCLYAARLDDSDQAIQRTLLRKWLGLVFRRLTRMFFHLPIHDSQCGFKFVPAKSYFAIRDQLTEERYCFDIDLTIHLLKTGTEIVEAPISWTETAGTKITLSQGTKMLRSLCQLRKKVG